MAKDTKQRQAAKEFVKDWLDKGYEKGETQRFWISLLHNVFGIDDPTRMMGFEIPVKTITKEKGSDFIDAYIPSTKVLIEQKGSHVDLSVKARQSDGSYLTPYQQGRRYAAGLPVSLSPRWIVACNFSTFEVHDMERPNDAPEIIQLADLEKEYHRLSFLVDNTNVHLKKELEVSIQAGEIVGVLYEKFREQYRDPDNPDSQKALNKLCVRLVFCLYAEDAGIFGSKNMFHDYMEQFPASEFREKLIKLFEIFDTRLEDRDPYLDEGLLAFPYVSGGMFAGEIEIPRITDEIRALILQRASDDFDWSMISPTIFGAVFESTLNPETRRAGGMHYTSIENIHKVIDPLFLDDLKEELALIKAEKVVKTQRAKAIAFQDKLAGLKFLDPACGSGNFLTESYTSLRRLENEAIRIIYGGNRIIGELNDPIKVSINQFYGIEINDFACSVTQTALWIAETQMMAETDEIVGYDLEPLPLKNYTNIHEGNALRMDWNEVIPASELNYIMGNPPFIGNARLSDEQKKDREALFPTGGGELDYVACWYKKAANYIGEGSIRCAFVSTNSICQGQQVSPLWAPLCSSGIFIDFAHKTFRWDSEANEKAAVHCVIIGFSRIPVTKKSLFCNDKVQYVEHINGYLLPAQDIFVDKRRQPLCPVPQVIKGFQPTDNGYLVLDDNEKELLLQKEPAAGKWIRPFITAKEYIHGKSRWCLWLVGASPAEINQLPEVKTRVTRCREWRSSQTVSGDAYKLKDMPSLMRPSGKFKEAPFIVLPRHSGENRPYIPFGFAESGDIPGDSVSIVPDATLYHFGVLCSSTHMAWTKVVCGRLEMRFRYTSDIVYNNFPWPSPSNIQKAKIEQTAQTILDARTLYPDSSLADLYDPDLMPIELRKAHRTNDAAVLEAYGFPKDATESEIVARLFKMYQELTSK